MKLSRLNFFAFTLIELLVVSHYQHPRRVIGPGFVQGHGRGARNNVQKQSAANGSGPQNVRG
jgi:hypothetical protein